MKRLIKLLLLLGILGIILGIQTFWRVQHNKLSRVSAKPVNLKKAPRYISANNPIKPFLKDVRSVKPTRSSVKVDALRAARGTNIIICVLDAARADHFGCYGYPRPTTPNIDRIAKESLVFEQHYCQYPATIHSTTSLFQSRYHLPEKRPSEPSSLVAWLQQAGFTTALFSASPNVDFTGKLNKGFERLVVTYRPSHASVFAISNASTGQKGDDFYLPERLLQPLADWCDEKHSQPFFLYAHFIPPHIPFYPPEEMAQLFSGKKPPRLWQATSAMPIKQNTNSALQANTSTDETVNLYDANLRYADWAVGELEKYLRKAGLWEQTLLIITADHGEAFNEHGYNWHSTCPYDEALHIPFIMHFPSDQRPVGRISALTQTIDVLPTLCDLFEAPYPTTAQGKSWLPMLAGQTRRTHDFIISAAGVSPPREGADICIVRDSRYTLLLHRDGKTRALYDHQQDPQQTRNQLTSQPQRAASLVQAFRQFALTQPDPPLFYIDPNAKWVLPKEEKPTKPKVKREMSETLKKQLRTLGYLK